MIVEVRGFPVADVRLQHERLDSLGAQCVVTAGVLGEIGDPRDLEPDEVRRVVRDALRVGLREAHRDVRVEVELVHAP